MPPTPPNTPPSTPAPAAGPKCQYSGRGLDCGRRWTSFTFTPHFHHRHHEEMDVSNTLYGHHSQMMSGLTETKTQYVMKQRVRLVADWRCHKEIEFKAVLPFLSFACSFNFLFTFAQFLFLCCSVFFLPSTFGADILFPPRCHIGSGICPPWFSLALPNLFLWRPIQHKPEESQEDIAV